MTAVTRQFVYIAAAFNLLISLPSRAALGAAADSVASDATALRAQLLRIPMTLYDR